MVAAGASQGIKADGSSPWLFKATVGASSIIMVLRGLVCGLIGPSYYHGLGLMAKYRGGQRMKRAKKVNKIVPTAGAAV
jgi:hypothetical protein